METIAEVLLAGLVALAVLHAGYHRLRLSRAKHPSLRGHSRWSRRIARLIPYFEYRGEQFFASDLAPPEVAVKRRQALKRLARHFAETSLQTLAAGQVHYGPNRGIPELRAAIAAKLRRQNGLEYDPDTEILVVAGLSEGVLATFMALLEPGDQVVFPEPAWPHYAACARLCGAT